MGTSENFSRMDNDDSPNESPQALRYLQALWAAQLGKLMDAGILLKAAEVAEAAGHEIELTHTHVYLDLEPKLIPYAEDSTLPDELVAFNGLMLTGIRRRQKDVGRYPVPVPVGMYFAPVGETPEQATDIHAGPMQTVRGALLPFSEDDAVTVHDLAAELDVNRHLFGLPLRADLLAPEATMQRIYRQTPTMPWAA